MPNELFKTLNLRFEELQAERQPFESEWQDVVNLVRPITSDFLTKGHPGEPRTGDIYDGTAPDALNDFVGGIVGTLTNSVDRWFSLDIEGFTPFDHTFQTLEWLDNTTRIIYDSLAVEAAGFNGANVEVISDMGAFGTGVMFSQWGSQRDAVMYRAYPFATVYFSENWQNQIDTIYRVEKKTKRQLEQQFREGNLPNAVLRSKSTTARWRVVHTVFPRSTSSSDSLFNTNFPFASFWFMPDENVVLSESGFLEFPYHIARWTKMANEPYGRAPGTSCLPDIRMVNRMEKARIKASEKAIDPAMLLPSEGFFLPIDVSPGSINYKEPGTQEEIQFLNSEARFDISDEAMAQKRDHIRKCFFNDIFRLQQKRAEVRQVEIQAQLNENLRMIAPIVARIQTEYLSHVIARHFNILSRVGKIQPAPAELEGRSLKVNYESIASRAQKGLLADAISAYLQELAPLAQVDPTALDAVDIDAAVQELGVARQVPRSILRNQQEVAQIRQARAQQQQLQQAAQVAQPLADAFKTTREAEAIAA